MYFEPDTHRDAVIRIHRITGRFTAFEKMLLPEDAYDISVQLMAIEGSVNRFSQSMHECFLTDVNLNLHTPLPAVSQTPERLQYIANTKLQLSSCNARQLQQIMRALKQQKNIH